MAKHAHELEAAGEPRWRARLKDNLLLVTDLASDEEVQATSYTIDGNTIRFSLPGDNGLRSLQKGEPGFEAFAKVIEKGPISAEGEKPAAVKASAA